MRNLSNNLIAVNSRIDFISQYLSIISIDKLIDNNNINLSDKEIEHLYLLKIKNY